MDTKSSPWEQSHINLNSYSFVHEFVILQTSTFYSLIFNWNFENWNKIHNMSPNRKKRESVCQAIHSPSTWFLKIKVKYRNIRCIFNNDSRKPSRRTKTVVFYIAWMITGHKYLKKSSSYCSLQKNLKLQHCVVVYFRFK